jgi:hypothetical protein
MVPAFVALTETIPPIVGFLSTVKILCVIADSMSSKAPKVLHVYVSGKP